MRIVILLHLGLLLATGSVVADTVFVAPFPKPGAMGTSWDDAIGLREALSKANPGDELWVAKGLYEVTGGPLIYRNGVHVYGGFAGHEAVRELRDWLRQRTILQSVGLDIIMTMTECDSSSRIDGVQFHGALQTGLAITGGDPRIFNCHFRRNGGETSDGGGIRATDVGRIRIEYCVFDSNQTTSKGGGIYIASTKVDAKGFGPFIGQCFFVANEAGQGGAIYMDQCAGTPQVVSSVFAGNQARHAGGALASSGLYVYVNNCTFSRNRLAEGYEYGGRTIAAQGGHLQNSIVWNGDENDTAAHVYTFRDGVDTTKITATANLVEMDFENGFWQVDPQFENADWPPGPDGYYGTDDDGLVPSSFSIARDGGFIDKFVNHRQQDILGNPRLVGRKIDLGAYESQRSGRVHQRELMDEMRRGKLVFMFRHTKTDWDQRDPGPSPECFPGRNLIAEGREQARSIGAHQRALGITQGDALSSPVCRCWETLEWMVGRHEKAQHWGTGNSAQAVAGRLRDLSTPPTNGCRNISTHDAVANLIFNADGGGSIMTTAELMEGDCLVVRPLGDTMEVISHWCSDTWERWWIKYNPDALSVRNYERPAPQLHVSPMPATDVVTIESPAESGERAVQILDVVGRHVWIGAVAGTVRINVSTWAPGLYVVHAGNASATFVVR